MLRLRVKLSAILAILSLTLLFNACTSQTNVSFRQQGQQIFIDGPYSYLCNEKVSDPITVTFYATNPPSLLVERGDNLAKMTLQPSASGSLYQGNNKSFWEHHGEARVKWGINESTIVCHKTQ